MRRLLILLAAFTLGLGACNRSKVENPIPLVSRSDRSVAQEVAADWLNTEGSPSLGGLKGKVVLLNFWATWCGPCRMEMPGLVAIYNKYHVKGFETLGLSLDRPDPNRNVDVSTLKKYVKDFVTNNGVTYPIGLADPMSAQSYQVSAIPASYLIDRDGKVAARLIGLYQEAQIDDAVERLLAEK